MYNNRGLKTPECDKVSALYVYAILEEMKYLSPIYQRAKPAYLRTSVAIKHLLWAAFFSGQVQHGLGLTIYTLTSSHPQMPIVDTQGAEGPNFFL